MLKLQLVLSVVNTPREAGSRAGKGSSTVAWLLLAEEPLATPSHPTFGEDAITQFVRLAAVGTILGAVRPGTFHPLLGLGPLQLMMILLGAREDPIAAVDAIADAAAAAALHRRHHPHPLPPRLHLAARHRLHQAARHRLLAAARPLPAASIPAARLLAARLLASTRAAIHAVEEDAADVVMEGAAAIVAASAASLPSSEAQAHSSEVPAMVQDSEVQDSVVSKRVASLLVSSKHGKHLN